MLQIFKTHTNRFWIHCSKETSYIVTELPPYFWVTLQNLTDIFIPWTMETLVLESNERFMKKFKFA